MRPLEGKIQALHELEGPALLDWFTKGHVDKQQFRDEVAAEWGCDYPVDQVQHTYARCVPADPRIWGRITLVYFDQKPGRGAFAATTLANTKGCRP